MTIASEVSKSGPYTGDGANTSFAYGFKVYDEAELRVIKTVISTGVEVDLVLNTDYTVNNVGSASGTIDYPISGSPLPATEKLTIVRDMTFTQLVDLENQGGYYPETVERVFDRIEQKLQQIKEVTDRSVKVDVSSSTDPDALLDDVNAAAAAAETAQTAAETAQGLAETAQTGAEAAETAALAAQTAAELALDTFTDLYLGAKTSDPALDNDGNPLQAGAMYFNTVTSKLKYYDGSAWNDTGQSTFTTFTYVATSGQTVFTGTDANGATLNFSSSAIMGVFLNGVSLREGATHDWVSSGGDTITLQSGATTGDIVEIKTAGAFTVADAITQTAADARYVQITDGLSGEFTPTKGNLLAGDGTTFAEVPVGSNGQVLTADSTDAEGVSWQTPAVTSVAVLQYQETAGTNQETYASGSWLTVSINTEVYDGDSIVGAPSAGAFTLATGTYLVHMSMIIQDNAANTAKVRLRNTTGGTTEVLGIPVATGGTHPSSSLQAYGVVTVSSASDSYEMQVYSTSALDAGGSIAAAGEVEVYAQISLTKIA